MSVSAIIMASGLSRRMKQNKLKMKINNKYLFEFILDTVNSCKHLFNEVVVVSNDEDIHEKTNSFKFKYVQNELSHFGQSVSIKLGVEHSCKTDGYMFFTADQPFISKATITELAETFEKSPSYIVAPSYKGICGSPVIFPEMYNEQLLKLEKDTGGKVIINNNRDKLILVHINSDKEQIDIDTMQDYEKVMEVLNEWRSCNS